MVVNEGFYLALRAQDIMDLIAQATDANTVDHYELRLVVGKRQLVPFFKFPQLNIQLSRHC